MYPIIRLVLGLIIASLIGYTVHTYTDNMAVVALSASTAFFALYSLVLNVACYRGYKRSEFLNQELGRYYDHCKSLRKQEA